MPNDNMNGQPAPAPAKAKDEIDAATGNLSDVQKHEMFRIWCALLHRMAWAAGGTLALRLKDIPDTIPFDFKSKDGIATFTAMPPPRLAAVHPAIARASKEQLDELKKQFPQK